MKIIRKYLVLLVLLTPVVTLITPAQAAVTFGVSTGVASAKGKESKHTYSNFTPYSIFVGFIGDTDYAFEIGYSQLADIKESDDKEDISVSLSGFFIAGRYFIQFNDTGFGFIKVGIQHWAGQAKTSDATSAGNVNDTKASASSAGFSPLLGLGADFVFPGGDYGIRVEYEHMQEVGDGMFDNTVVGQSTGFITEGYTYERINVGVQVAF